LALLFVFPADRAPDAMAAARSTLKPEFTL
jgi:hypothetical protein